MSMKVPSRTKDNVEKQKYIKQMQKKKHCIFSSTAQNLTKRIQETTAKEKKTKKQQKRRQSAGNTNSIANNK